MNKILAVVFIVAGIFVLTACNTMEGVGKDVQKGGEKIENSADQHK